jgi:CheY-like chemotaxis protein
MSIKIPVCVERLRSSLTMLPLITLKVPISLYDLLSTDINMPKMNDFELSQNLIATQILEFAICLWS